MRISKNTTTEAQRTYTCSQCKAKQVVRAEYKKNFVITHPKKCPRVSSGCHGYMKMFNELPDAESFLKYQEVLIQKLFSHKQIPESFTVTLENDLIDSCVPGESVKICGVVEDRWNPLIEGQPAEIFVMLRAVSVLSMDQKTRRIGAQEQKMIIEYDWFNSVYTYGELGARDLLIDSLFPSIKGMYYPKLALALAMCGGIERLNTNGREIRSQSHLLFVGDPTGTDKSRLLKEASSYISPSYFTTGSGCSSAGLTVACVNNKNGGGWELEAGALVRCNGGLCCINEFNLLQASDKASIHEAMEQQTVSVAKGGMVTKFSSRCSIIAALNPKVSNHQIEEDLTTDCIGLSSPLLSRFDLIFAIVDERDDAWDEEVADFILADCYETKSTLWSHESLRTYFSNVRNIEPLLPSKPYEILAEYSRYCRSDQFRDVGRTSMRMNDSLIRLAISHAKLLCRKTVRMVDSVMAILLMESSMGFGRFFPPLNLVKAALPLEPSRVTILAILKRLGLDKWRDDIEENATERSIIKSDEEDVSSQPLFAQGIENDPSQQVPTQCTASEEEEEDDCDSQKSFHSQMKNFIKKNKNPTQKTDKEHSFEEVTQEEATRNSEIFAKTIENTQYITENESTRTTEILDRTIANTQHVMNFFNDDDDDFELLLSTQSVENYPKEIKADTCDSSSDEEQKWNNSKKAKLTTEAAVIPMADESKDSLADIFKDMETSSPPESDSDDLACLDLSDISQHSW